MIPKRTCISKGSHFLLSNKKSGNALWFIKKYPSQRCCTFVPGWFFIAGNQHDSFFIGKYTFQNQKLTIIVFTMHIKEFQKLTDF